MVSPHVRPFVDSDLSRVAEIHVYGWRAAYRGLIPDTVLFGDRQVARAMRMHERLGATAGIERWVFDDGLIRGFVIDGDARDAVMSGFHEISALYVEPAFWGDGVGRALFACAAERGRKRERYGVYLWVLDGNDRAVRFYMANGMVDSGVTRDDEGLVERRFDLRFAAVE